jgi:hypothetical protein
MNRAGEFVCLPLAAEESEGRAMRADAILLTNESYPQIIHRLTVLEQRYWQRERDAIVARIQILEASVESRKEMRRAQWIHD